MADNVEELPVVPEQVVQPPPNLVQDQIEPPPPPNLVQDQIEPPPPPNLVQDQIEPPPPEKPEEIVINSPKNENQQENPNNEKVTTTTTPPPVLQPEYLIPFGSLGGIGTSTLPSEEKELTWKIPHFPDIFTVLAGDGKVNIKFEIGDEIGLLTKWEFYLKKAGDDIAVWLYLERVPDNWRDKKVYAGFIINLMHGASIIRTRTMPVRDYSQVRSYGWQSWMRMSEMTVRGSNMMSSNNETVTFVVKFTIFNSYKGIVTEGKAIDKAGIVAQAEAEVPNNSKVLVEEGRKSMVQDFGELLSSGSNADVTFQAGDGTSFKAHKIILSARSPVFFAMFESQMSEGRTGHVDMEDMSGPALNILLKFIYTSEFDVGVGEKACVWQTVCGQIINAAAKYSLPILKDQCDEHLIQACTHDNALPLLRLARLHGMTIAEGKLKEWIKANVDTVLDGGV